MTTGLALITEHRTTLKEKFLLDRSNPAARPKMLDKMANAEFKRDPRYGEYKLIECNARFTVGNPLVLRSGVKFAEYVYCQVTGRPAGKIGSFHAGMRMWDPWRDYAAIREWRTLNDLDFSNWIVSILHPPTFPLWSWSDRGPAVLLAVLWPARKLRAWSRNREGRVSA